MRNRPADTHEAVQAFPGAAPIVSPPADDWEDLAAHVNGAFVVVVETPHGTYRRRVWLTLAPAERAARAAQDAGHNAVVLLAELRPLYRVEGSKPDLGRIVTVSKGGAV